MSEQHLHQLLRDLDRELEQTAGENRERLQQLSAEIESQLQHPDQNELIGSLIERVQVEVERLESEHPTATAVLNNIAYTLSNIGI